MELDEPVAHVGEGPEVLQLEVVGAADDEIWEELGETFVENVTGADDAATEHLAEETGDDGALPAAPA